MDEKENSQNSEPKKSSKWWVWVVAALVVILLILGGIGWGIEVAAKKYFTVNKPSIQILDDNAKNNLSETGNDDSDSKSSQTTLKLEVTSNNINKVKDMDKTTDSVSDQDFNQDQLSDSEVGL